MTYNELLTLLARYIHRINDIDIVQMCGLTYGTTPTTLQTQKAIVFQLYNEQVSYAATDNITMTACAQQAVSTFCYYLVSINSAGTIVVTKGTDNTYTLPTNALGYTAIGALKITTDGVTTFTSGTTYLDAAGITTVFYDIDCGIATTLINSGQRKMENGIVVNLNGSPVRVSNFDHMKIRAQVTINTSDDYIDNFIPNYKELANAHIIDSAGRNYPELERIDYNEALVRWPLYNSGDGQGRPLTISRIPGYEATLTPDAIPEHGFLLRPTSDATYTLSVTAFQYSPYLDGVVYSTNWWTQYQPDILLLAALVEAEPYLKQDERMATWEKKLGEALSGLAGSQRVEKYSGSVLNIGFCNPLNSGRYYIDTDTWVV